MRFFIFSVQLLIGGLLFLWLMSQPEAGSVKIDWLGYNLQMSIGVFLGMFLLLIGVGGLFLKFLKGCIRLPKRWFQHRKEEEKKRAWESLIRVISAYAYEGLEYESESLKHSLSHPETCPLATFFAAVLAKQQGKTEEEFKHLIQLTQFSGTQALGYAGLIVQASGKEALHHARQALPYIGQGPHLGKAVFESFLKEGFLTEAEQTLDQIKYLKLFPKPLLKKWEGRLLLAKAHASFQAHNASSALKEAKKAYEVCPEEEEGLAYAHHLIAGGQMKHARQILEKVWVQHPDARILEMYFSTYEKLDPCARYEVVEKLTQRVQDNPVALLSCAQVAMEAQLWGIAQSHLQQCQDIAPDHPGLLKKRAEYELKTNQDAQAALPWLTKLADHFLPSGNGR